MFIVEFCYVRLVGFFGLKIFWFLASAVYPVVLLLASVLSLNISIDFLSSDWFFFSLLYFFLRCCLATDYSAAAL